jgi:hypothetical protein
MAPLPEGHCPLSVDMAWVLPLSFCASCSFVRIRSTSLEQQAFESLLLELDANLLLALALGHRCGHNAARRVFVGGCVVHTDWGLGGDQDTAAVAACWLLFSVKAGMQC